MLEIAMMDEDRFWSIIAQSRALVDGSQCAHGDDFQNQQSEQLRALLLVLEPEAVVAFDMRSTALENAAYRWDLWNAAYWAYGGCGNDGFLDFRANLISLGRSWFWSVLADPDTLVDLIDRPDVPYLLGEGFGYLPGEVYEARTGRQIQEHFGAYPTAPDEPVGERIDMDDPEAIQARLPRLFARFPEMGD